MSSYNLPPTLPFRFSLPFMFFLSSNLLFHFITWSWCMKPLCFVSYGHLHPQLLSSHCLVEGEVLHLDVQDCGLIRLLRYRFQSVPLSIHIYPPPGIILYFIFSHLCTRIPVSHTHQQLLSPYVYFGRGKNKRNMPIPRGFLPNLLPVRGRTLSRPTTLA